MRRVTLGTTGIETSALGFGAAGLGSRVGAEAGARALAEAFDGGVTWLDLAPVYGAGAAEAIAAPFLRAHREAVQVATKAGLGLGRGYAGGGGGLRAALLPLARRAIGSIGPLRRAVRASGATGNAKLPLTPALLTASLDASLARLGTDRVELFLLHGATPEEVARDDIRRALEDILAAGKARSAGVAGDAAAAGAALATGFPYAVIQSAAPAPGTADPLAPAAGAAGFGRITHSVFGVGATWETLRRRLAADAAAAALLAGEGGAEAGLAAALLARALAANPDGTVLVSMLSARSRARNLAAAAGAPAAAEAGLARLLAGG